MKTTGKNARKKTAHIKSKDQADFINLLADLLGNGFTLQESFSFMEKILPQHRSVFALLDRELSKGTLFYQTMMLVGLPPLYVAQLRLADVHGDLIGTLSSISQQLKTRSNQKSDVMRVSAYPIILLAFLFGVILLMRVLLLPQLSGMYDGSGDVNLGLVVIEYGPIVFLGALLLGSLLALIVKIYFQRKSAIRQSIFLTSLPLVKHLFKFYYTAFFASEWGKLLNQGLEMKQVLTVMGGEGSTRLMNEIATRLTRQLERGEGIHHQIKDWSFFQVELSLIIQQGEAKGKLGDELMIYSERLRELLDKKVKGMLTWIQPLVFLLVALLIVLVYTGLLLPLYQGMENYL